MPIRFNLREFSKDKKIFVETGTYLGDGVRRALNSGFTEVHSIELDTNRYNHCVKKFKNDKRVHLYHGNSGILLEKVLTKINKPVVFWIDAHFMGEDMRQVEIADKWCPMNEELEAIKNHRIKNHTILIDDIRCINLQHIDKKTQKPVGFPGKENLIKKIIEINPAFKITYLPGHIPNDVLCAKI